MHCAQCNCMKFAIRQTSVSHTLQELKNRYCVLFGALFCHIFAIIFPEEPALLLPKTAETPSRGPLAPLYGGKGSAPWGSRGTVTQRQPWRADPQEPPKYGYTVKSSFTSRWTIPMIPPSAGNVNTRSPAECYLGSPDDAASS